MKMRYVVKVVYLDDPNEPLGERVRTVNVGDWASVLAALNEAETVGVVTSAKVTLEQLLDEESQQALLELMEAEDE